LGKSTKESVHRLAYKNEETLPKYQTHAIYRETKITQELSICINSVHVLTIVT